MNIKLFDRANVKHSCNIYGEEVANDPDIVVAIIVIVYIFVFVVSGIVVTEGEGGSIFLDNSCVFTVFVLYLLCLYYILCLYFIY